MAGSWSPHLIKSNHRNNRTAYLQEGKGVHCPRHHPRSHRDNDMSLLAKTTTAIALLQTPKEAAKLLKVSTSWLAKARMRGDGPPYIRIGRSIRYTEAALIQWMKAHQRLSTSEQS